MKTPTIYAISRGYRKLTLWHGNDKTNERMFVSTVAPFATLSRMERYQTICAALKDESIKPPAYQAKDRAS